MDKAIEDLIEPKAVLRFAITFQILDFAPVQDLAFSPE
jgi:hypothetical protein